jgi:hypothetical protein
VVLCGAVVWPVVAGGVLEVEAARSSRLIAKIDTPITNAITIKRMGSNMPPMRFRSCFTRRVGSGSLEW